MFLWLFLMLTLLFRWMVKSVVDVVAVAVVEAAGFRLLVTLCYCDWCCSSDVNIAGGTVGAESVMLLR